MNSASPLPTPPPCACDGRSLAADDIVRMALATPRMQPPSDRIDPAVLAAHKARLPGVPLYTCRLEVFRPIPLERFATVSAIVAAADGDAGREEEAAVLATMVESALLHPAMDDVLEEAAFRPSLLGTLALEVLRISGFGPSYEFVRV